MHNTMHLSHSFQFQHYEKILPITKSMFSQSRKNLVEDKNILANVLKCFMRKY